ncbi:hypothetical protein ACHAQA_009781 [Verticillium albo-atrum]
MPTSVAPIEPVEVINGALNDRKEPPKDQKTSLQGVSPRTRKSVAVIGAGASGVMAAAHLLRRHQKVTVFERAPATGGVWRYEEDTPDDPAYPAPAHSDGLRSASPLLRNGGGKETNGASSRFAEDKEPLSRKAFAPPGPCYAGLRSNIATYLMRSSLTAWPESAGRDIVHHDKVRTYVQELARDFGVDAVTEFNTRVEEVVKPEGGGQWRVRTLRLDASTSETKPKFVEQGWNFDAVVVASGHYDIPFIPSIPGLAALKERFPGRVIHSKQYRRPETFANQDVVVVGGRVSSVDISRELSGVTKHTYQSVREGAATFNFNTLNEDTERISEIDHIVHDTSSIHDSPALQHDDTLPVQLHLKDGRILRDVHAIILATGYHLTYPYLMPFEVSPDQVTPASLVEATKKTVHNLYKDIFYIPDPTLTFVGTPFDVVTFACFDYQAQAVAQVLSGAAALPSPDAMRAEYEARLQAKGSGKQFHSLRGGGEVEYVRELVAWLNGEAARLGIQGQDIKGHSDEWIEGYWVLQQRVAGALGLQGQGQGSETIS